MGNQNGCFETMKFHRRQPQDFEDTETLGAVQGSHILWDFKTSTGKQNMISPQLLPHSDSIRNSSCF